MSVSLISHVAASLLALSLVLFIYRRDITPIYGSAPTTYALNSVVLSASLVPAVLQYSRRNLLAAAFVASLAPLSTYWVAAWTARWDMPIVGPLVTHLGTIWPFTALLASLVPQSSAVVRVLLGLVSCTGAIVLSDVWERVEWLWNLSATYLFTGLTLALINTWVVSYPRPISAPKKKKAPPPKTRPYRKLGLFLALNGGYLFASRFLASPILPHPLPTPYHHPTFPLIIHSSVQSLTGLIVVGEALPPPTYRGGPDADMHSFRYMRADHSLLGGVWVGGKVATLDDVPPQVDSFGTPLGDSIYSTFVLHEAARLVNSTGRTPERAVIIGLGVGISPIGFSRHGIETALVEIDPAVYEAATLYFGLAEHDPERLFLEDARQWAADRRANKADPSFDIIVHDCFSGGGVPEHIFTIEFWEDLKASLHPQGVLVVNFAGSIVSDSSRMISQTLLKSFGNCRAFTDAQHTITEAEYETELLNLVFFCTPHSAPLTFRKAKRADYLDSYLRRGILSTLPEREVRFELLTGELDDRFIVTDEHNLLGKLQDNLGHHHWQLMRQVLTDVFWETF
uniref:Spermidine synthase n=1 Tax=Mycena chlorophos TaxID=658473 RepID=A0ABQ0LPR2_MYCCL|nr:spermidine synthase [Mycena chlorophos]